MRWRAIGCVAAALALSGAAPAFAAFPGANGRIAFVRDGTVWTAAADGSDQVALAPGTAPAWSADGTRLAFERDGQIWVMNADGSGQAAVTATIDPAQHPTWSPDGRLAYDTGAAIWVANADGSDAHPVTPVAGPDTEFGTFQPDWTGTGDWIAFSYASIGCPCSNIGSVRPDGTGFLDGGPRWAVFDFNYDPEFSPDGQHLAFTIAGGHHDGSVIVVDGSEITPEDRGTPESWVTSDFAAWSPDGTQIAYATNLTGQEEGRTDVYATRLSDGTATPLITNATQPDWQAMTALDCSGVTVRPRRLRPDHRLHRVRLDAPPQLPDVTITRVTSNRPHARRDVFVAPDRRSVRLRGRRHAVYTIAFAAAGGGCDGTATVTVRDRR